MKRFFLAVAAGLALLPLSTAHAQNLIHRYSFHGNANDSIGTANGIIIGNVVIQTDSSNPAANGTAVFGGGTMASSPSYISLPASAVSGLQNAAIEIFTTNFHVPSDYGGSGSAFQTLFAAATAYPDTTNYMILCPDRGTGSGLDALGAATRINGGPETDTVAVNPLPAWAQNHVVDMVWSGFTGVGTTGTQTIYLDGQQVAQKQTTLSFAAMSATSEGIATLGIGGGSPFNDPTFSGSINEVRVFDAALSPSQVAANVAAGPGTVGAAPAMNLSGVTVSAITSYSALVSWVTTNPAGAAVQYGTTTQYGRSQLGADDTTAHSVLLSALQPGTTYHYAVSSTDNFGQAAASADSVFTTAPPAELVSLQTPSQLPGGGTGNATVALSAPAPAGGALVSLSTLYSAQVQIPASILIPAGQQSASFSVMGLVIGNQATVAITASYAGVSVTGQTTILPAGSVALSLSPTTIGPGVSSSGTVTIAVPAGPGGVPIALSSDSSAVTVPASVVIPSGQTSASFSAMGNSVSQTTIARLTASMAGAGASSPQTVTVQPAFVFGLSVSPESVVGGGSAVGTATLSAAAPTGGLTVSLESGDPSVSVPASVLVPSGSATATFPVTTTSVARTTDVILSASEDSSFPQAPAGATQTTTLTVQPPTVSSLAVAPAAVFGGNSATGTLTLSDTAPAGGTTVNLLSSNPSAASVPATVNVPAGTTSTTFPITTYAVGSPVTISASTNPAFPPSPVGATQTASLTVSTVGFTLGVSPATVSLGTSATGTITLSGAAPTGGLIMYLSANNPIAGETDPVTIPTTVTVAAGAKTATFPIITQAVSASVRVTVSASPSANFPAGGTQTATLAVAASSVSLSLSAASVAAGAPVTGTITLSGPAPTGGETVSLTSSNAAAASVPATVAIAAGASTATFPVLTHAGGSGIAITATVAGQSAAATLSVTANAGQSYGAGWELLSLPYDFTGQTPAQIFGFSSASLYYWSASQLGYVQTPTAPADTVHPGRGYWVYFPQAAQVTTVGTPTDPTQPFFLPLQVGWNMIGDPFSSSVSVSSLTATVNTSVYSYGNAGSLLLALYGYTAGASGAVGSYTSMGSGGTLSPGQGYWLYATQALTLTFPAPSASTPPPPAAPGLRR